MADPLKLTVRPEIPVASPPPGYVIDDEARPGPPGALPPGFTIDTAAQTQAAPSFAAPPAPPAGFQLDEPSQFDKTVSDLFSPERGMFPFNYLPTQQKLAGEAQQGMAEGVQDWQEGNKLTGAGRVGLNAALFAASPIDAGIHSIVGQPLENNFGLPARYTDFAAGLAVPGIGMTKAPKVVKQIFAPETVSPEAAEGAAILRRNTGIGARASEITAAELEPHRATISMLPEPARLDLIGYIEGTHQRPVVPELQQVADKLRAAFLDRRHRLAAMPSTAQTQFIDDYFPHFWQDPGAARQFANNYGGGSKQGSGASLKKRSIPTIEDGIAAGLVPLTSDPIEAALRYVTSMDKFIAAMQTLDTAKAMGLIQYIKPKTMGASGHPDSFKVPVGWEPIEGRGAINAQGAHAYAPEGFARVYNNYISKGYHGIGQGEYGAAYDTIRMGTNATTQMLLSLSGYHAFTMAEAAMSNKMTQAVSALRHGEVGDFVKHLAQVPVAPVTTGLKGSKAKQVYLGQVAGTPEQRELIDLITQAGGRMAGSKHALDYQSSAAGSYFKAYQRAQLQTQMMDSLARASGGSMATVKEVGSHIGRIMDTMNQPLFEHYIPNLKNGAAMDNLSQWLKQNPGATQADKLAAARQIVDSIDNRFGEMIHDNIFWNKFGKQTAMVAMLSYSWSMGAWRELGGGVRDMARSSTGAAQDFGAALKHMATKPGQPRPTPSASPPAWSPKSDYVVGMALNWALMSSFYQYMKTGEYPQDMRDILAPRTGGTDSRSGEPERIIPPGIMKDVYGYYAHFWQEAGNKASPGVRLLGQTISGKDWRGDPVFSPRDEGESMAHKAPQWLAEYFALVAKNITPIQVQNMTKGKEEGSNLNAAEKLLGVRTAPRQFVDPEGHEAMLDRMWRKSWFGRKGRGGKLGHDAAEESRYGGPQ